ncbi:MAG TPA: penicillin acylase family protein [Longimicrobiales bacterium]
MSKSFALAISAIFVLQGAARAQAPTPSELARWQRHAAAVTITRDDWGIAHVHGRTDADAVFGVEYAQAEDDFNRVETNYINALGRLAEAEGAGEVWRDLRMKLFIDPDSLKAQYARSPAWLRRLMDAYADALNYYLYRNPQVHPRVIAHFEPWMALSFTEGSIGGDIETIDLRQLEAFYGQEGDAGRVVPALSRTGTAGAATSYTQAVSPEVATSPVLREPGGSNGIAIAPKLTRGHHALLWINPHTSFYFRSELQMTSDEGLDAYGAVTWGQFFIYQGFNRSAGWMHTSSNVDNIDEFLESVTRQNGKLSYRYGGKLLPVRTKLVTVPYRATAGMARRTFTVFFTQHGPVVRQEGGRGRWVSVALMSSPVNALIQSYSRTKAHDLAEWRRIMGLHTNSSNNTVFADSKGHIAYLHSNYIPRRDNRFDWTKPVDGSDPATAYHGVLSIEQTPNAINPPNGWVFNVNNWPWSAAGKKSPRRQDFPRYVERSTEETPRGVHALRLLTGSRDWTMESLRAAAFDSYLPAFAVLIPRLLLAYDTEARARDKEAIAPQIALLRSWDYRWGAGSIPTSLAVFWGTELMRRMPRVAHEAGLSVQDWALHQATNAQLLQALEAASDKLAADFGSWRTPWGEVNRFQRLDDAIDPRFDDAKPSSPVPFTSSVWGSLASFGARQYPNTKKWYGSSGNSFLAVVEFGDSVRARAVTAGGESGDPSSPHFQDQAKRYASGNLREVYFYPSQLKGHTERMYHPGS